MKKIIFAICMGFFMLCNITVVNADYMLIKGNLGKQQRNPIPKLYETIEDKYMFEEAGSLNNPQDIFIDSKDNIYIADTGNNRIIKLNPDGTLVRVYDEDNSVKLSRPEGVYVDKDGDIYIADTGNKRIAHISPEGMLVEEFGNPKGTGFDNNDSDFIPRKLYISLTGYLYVIRQYMLMSIDGNNDFKGFIASSNVKVSLSDILLRSFYSDEQKRKLTKLVPETFLNFVITDDGMVYGTTLTDSAQIKKINGVGKNIYDKDKTFGETFTDTKGEKVSVKNPEFVDIAVDKAGIVTVIEKNTNNLYQYDQDGNNIGVFGGPGTNKGQFKLPSSLAVNSKGNLYILDSGKRNLQVMEPTEYCRDIHEALVKYHNGMYIEATKEWEKVQKINAGNPLVHKGIAKAYYKQGQYLKAMEHYKIANDKEGYSDAFREYRHDFIREKFSFIVLAGIILLILLIKLLRLANEFAGQEIA